MQLKTKPEILSPCGNFEKLRFAVRYGADAVYLAGEEFGMRTAASNFGIEDLKKGVEYAHNNNVKVHLACNTIPHNEEIPRLPAFLEQVNDIGVDAIISADLGTIGLVKKYAPKAKQIIHQTWAYEADSFRLCNELGYKTPEDMFADIETPYKKAADDITPLCSVAI